MKILLAVIVAIVGLIVIAALLVTGVLFLQSKRKPRGSPQYVALGSSFAAGIGLGPRAPRSRR